MDGVSITPEGSAQAPLRSSWSSGVNKTESYRVSSISQAVTPFIEGIFWYPLKLSIYFQSKDSQVRVVDHWFFRVSCAIGWSALLIDTKIGLKILIYNNSNVIVLDYRLEESQLRRQKIGKVSIIVLTRKYDFLNLQFSPR